MSLRRKWHRRANQCGQSPRNSGAEDSPQGQWSPRAGTPGSELRGGLLEGIDARLDDDSSPSSAAFGQMELRRRLVKILEDHQLALERQHARLCVSLLGVGVEEVGGADDGDDDDGDINAPPPAGLAPKPASERAISMSSREGGSPKDQVNAEDPGGDGLKGVPEIAADADASLMGGGGDRDDYLAENSAEETLARAHKSSIISRVTGAHKMIDQFFTAMDQEYNEQTMAWWPASPGSASKRELFWAWTTWFMGLPIDALSALMVLCSTMVLFMDLQWQGATTRASLGLDETGDADSWGNPEAIFQALDTFFVVCFLGELILRLWFEGRGYLKDAHNILDTLVIISCATHSLLIGLFMTNLQGGSSVVVMRVLRVLKLLRSLRIFRLLRSFHDLRVLIRTCVSSFMALIWSMLLLIVLMMTSALFLCQSLQVFMQDPSNDMDARVRAETNWGSAGKAFWTMFEITFAGSWPSLVRPLIRDISVWYAVFFYFYIGLVVFAVIRIITALFLKETLAIAAQDTDMVMETQMKEGQRFAEVLKKIFNEVDTSGDGMITYEELQALTGNRRVKAHLHAIDMTAHQIETMFTLLQNGDGEVSFEEFLNGMTRMKGHVRSVDIVQLLHLSKTILGRLETSPTPGLGKSRSRELDGRASPRAAARASPRVSTNSEVVPSTRALERVAKATAANKTLPVGARRVAGDVGSDDAWRQSLAEALKMASQGPNGKKNLFL